MLRRVLEAAIKEVYRFIIWGGSRPEIGFFLIRNPYGEHVAETQWADYVA